MGKCLLKITGVDANCWVMGQRLHKFGAFLQKSGTFFRTKFEICEQLITWFYEKRMPNFQNFWARYYYKVLCKLHSPSKCLAWVKKCRHVWLDHFDPSLLTLTGVHRNFHRNFVLLKKKKIKMADSKNWDFQLHEFSICFRKFQGLVLGLVG